MSVISMRDFSSLRCTLTAKMLTWLVSMSSAISDGSAVSGRGARSSSTNALKGEPSVAQFLRDAGGNFAAGVVGDERDFLVGLNAQAGVDGVIRAGRELGIKGSFGEIGENGLNQVNPFDLIKCHHEQSEGPTFLHNRRTADPSSR